MPYGKGSKTTFVPFAPSLTLQDYVDLRHQAWCGLATTTTMHHWRFTNLWRELDRTTVYIINNVLPRYDTLPEQLLELAAFRSLGKIETDQVIEKHWGSWNNAMLAGYDAVYAVLPDKPLTNAYSRIVGIKRALKAGFIIKAEHRHKTAACDLENGSIAMMLDGLGVGTYLGKFGATQVLLDLTWRGGEWEPWQPTILGPGAAHGLGLALGRTCTTRRFGNVDTDPSTFTQDDLVNLAWQIGVIDPPLINRAPAPIEVRELENILCEYSRYCRMVEFGRVPTMRLYTPNPDRPPLPPGWPRGY
jgi:hypothetical protein